MKKNKIILTCSTLALVIFLSCVKKSPRAPSENPIMEVSLSCADTKYEYWENSQYVLPYPVGKSYTISLSHCSGSYHSEGQPDQFAIDFVMGIGTLITASRAGEVVFVEESGYDGQFPNNKVVVEHLDGTYLQYMHLTHDGAIVKVGQSIQQGEAIGLSGNTGLAGFPHLHLVATTQGSWEYPYKSFPTTFRNTKENEKSLKQGESYEALPY